MGFEFVIGILNIFASVLYYGSIGSLVFIFFLGLMAWVGEDCEKDRASELDMPWFKEPDVIKTTTSKCSCGFGINQCSTGSCDEVHEKAARRTKINMPLNLEEKMEIKIAKEKEIDAMSNQEFKDYFSQDWKSFKF